MDIIEIREYLLELRDYYNKQATDGAYSGNGSAEAHNESKRLLCNHLIEKIDDE